MIAFSKDISKLAPALAKAQADMGSVAFDSKNPAFRSKYASLASCLAAALPALKAHGVMLTQHPSYDPSVQVVTVTTMLLHTSGQWMQSSCALPLGGKKDGHALKSATTYLRRIGVIGILGLPEEDDDGNATSGVASRPVRAAVSTPAGRSNPTPSSSARVSEEDISAYHVQLKGAGLDPKMVAAFMHTHGKPAAASATAEQLHNRLLWAQRNAATILQWGEQS
jgi:hypothetical protein